MIQRIGLAASVALFLALGAVTASAEDKDADAGVTVVTDVSYYDGKDRDAKKNCLDLYVPKGEGPFPVLAWVHGGAWKMGDKALFKHVGKAFARRGIVTAIVGYRLSPGVAHPEHVRDVARALAWLKKNVKDHKGDPDALFVSGQSAGGHLAALVSLDPKWLKEQDLELSALKGAIPMSGVYGKLALATFPDAFPAETRDEATPLNHVADSKERPPFFVAWGDGDPLNLRVGAKALVAKLEENGAKPKSLEAKDRGHITIVTKIGSEKDELTEAVAAWVKETAGKKPEK